MSGRLFPPTTHHPPKKLVDPLIYQFFYFRKRSKQRGQFDNFLHIQGMQILPQFLRHENLGRSHGFISRSANVRRENQVRV